MELVQVPSQDYPLIAVHGEHRSAAALVGNVPVVEIDVGKIEVNNAVVSDAKVVCERGRIAHCWMINKRFTDIFGRPTTHHVSSVVVEVNRITLYAPIRYTKLHEHRVTRFRIKVLGGH